MWNKLWKWVTFPIRWFFISTEKDVYWINKFADWFGSVPAFKQQVFLMVVWLIIVIVHPKLDPSLFLTMAILTIYSAITQPMLAVGTSRSNELNVKLLRNNVHQMQALLDLFEKLEDNNELQMDGIYVLFEKLEDMMEQVREIQKSDSKQIDDIEQDLERMANKIAEILDKRLR